MTELIIYVLSHLCPLLQNSIIVSFTIKDTNATEEDGSEPKEPLRGIMTNYGYSLPDPNHPDRKSVWFTGGTIEPADDSRLDEWKKIFSFKTVETDTDGGNCTDNEAEKARTLASKILLGIVHEPIDSQGVVGYHLNRPIGGHGSTYVELVYMDDELRIMRGHSGSVYVMKNEMFC